MSRGSGGRRRAALATAFLAVLPAGAHAADPAQAPPGALACGGCHGASVRDGALLPRITGRPAADIATTLAAFRSGERASTVMGRIAKGFSPQEDQAIAAWLAEQK